jgi:hypothetical protein
VSVRASSQHRVFTFQLVGSYPAGRKLTATSVSLSLCMHIGADKTFDALGSLPVPAQGSAT